MENVNGLIKRMNNNRKLEEIFDLPSVSNVVETDNVKNALNTAKEIKSNLPTILDDVDMAQHDIVMDDYADDAYQHARDIVDLGMTSEPRHSADLFQAAANMMRIALDSKNSKVDKRLKMYELELKKKKLELDERRFESMEPPNIDMNTDGKIFADREDLM